jgi:hypothetical protein
LHRIELGVTPNAPLWVYASFAAGGSSSSPPAEVWRSTDGGATYVLISTPGQLGAQGWYDNAVWVDPTNANHVVIGGVSRYRSTDGVNFSQMGSAAPGIHVDHHAIVSDPGYDGITNRKVYYGNDGGIYRLEDATAGPSFPFTRLNNNYGVTQFYAGAGHAASGRIVGGTQDNGTLVYTPANGPQNWTTMFGADGGFSAADQTNANYLYGETQWLGVHRSANAGLGSTIITGCAGPAPLLDACNFTTNFISPILLDPNDQNRLYGGGRSLWRNSDARNSSNWSAVKGPTATSVNISSIAVAPGNPDLIWIGHGSVPSASGSGGDVFKTTNGTDAAPFWSKMDDNSPGLPNRVATSIAIDPASSDTVYVAFGGYTTGNLWKTTNGGITWTNVSGTGPGTLPSVPVRSVVVHPTVPNWVYVGTDVGVFASEDGGATWQVPHDGPANVAVFQLFWMNTTLVAVTHGRGMYTADAAAAPPAAFNKVAPLSGGVNQPAGVAASWQASTGATSYEVCYDQTDDDSCGTGWRPVGNDTLAFLGEVRGGGTYFWQVRARNTGGTVEANGGTWWSLTVESIGKLGPAFGTGDLPTSVPLSWQSSAGSATYEYCVDTINNQRCDSAWVPVGGATGAVVPVGAGGTYFWQVRAVSAGGPVELNEGAWWRFSTSGAFSKVGPGSDTSGHPMDVLLSWQASTGATGYEYCVDLTNNGTCDGAWVSAGTNTSALVSGLTAGATYYWQVRALTAGGPVAANSGVWWHFTRQPAPAMLASLAQHRPLVLGTRRRLGDPRTLFPTIA